MKSRAHILGAAARLVREIELDLATIEHWNSVRPETPFDIEEYDPGGVYRTFVARWRRILATDRGQGPIGEVE